MFPRFAHLAIDTQLYLFNQEKDLGPRTRQVGSLKEPQGASGPGGPDQASGKELEQRSRSPLPGGQSKCSLPLAEKP